MNSVEKGVKISMLQTKGPMSQHCFSKFPMSRHYVEKVLKLWQCRDISRRRESTDSLNVATTKQCRDISQSLNIGDHHIQCHDIRIGNVATFTQGNLIGETSQNVATLNKCRDINQKYWQRITKPSYLMLRHQTKNVMTSA